MSLSPNDDFKTYWIPGNPIPQSRARYSKKGWFYDPHICKIAKQNICNKILQQGVRKFDGPVAISIRLFFLRLKGDTDWYPVKKRYGDWDNLGKLVSDAISKKWGISGLLINDDSYIVVSIVTKHFSDIPGTELQIMEMKGPDNICHPYR